MRTFGVEEKLLLVHGTSLGPLPAGEWAVNLQQEPTGSGHQLETELQQEQMEVTCPPQTTLEGQLAGIRAGRALADEVAARVGGRVVGSPTAPGPVTPHVVRQRRAQKVRERFGLTAAEQLACGFHVHVAVDSREEGVAVLDRIRVWLPVLLGLSANSPFWSGTDTGFASYRCQPWSRWPTAGPADVFGTATAYDRHRQALLDSGVVLDEGLLYFFDAGLREHQPTVEVRIADVCLDAEHAAVIATLIRALVETAARQWAAGVEPVTVPASLLRVWTWQASRTGVEAQLINPTTGTPAPAGDVVAQLLEILHLVLAEYGEHEAVETVVADILREGSGARRQREAYRQRSDVHDVVRMALEATYHVAEAPSRTPPNPAV